MRLINDTRQTWTCSRKIKRVIQFKFLGHNPAKFSIHDTVVGRHYLN